MGKNKIEAKKTIVVTDNDITKTSIEDKADKTDQKTGFSKKRIILLVIFTILGLVVVGLTVKFVLQINWSAMFTSIRNGFDRTIGTLWFFLLLFYFVYSIANNFLIVWLRLRKLGYKISAAQYLLLGLASSFFRAVTPSIMSDSFTLIWMKSNGVPTYRVTSILFSNTLFWQVIQLLVTFPSFVFVLIKRDALIYTNNGINSEGLTVFIFMCAGITIDVFSSAFVFLLCWSRRTHYFLSKVFNWFKKKFHMKYHTKAEIAEKYKSKAVIKQDFISYLKDWKTTLWIILILVFAEIIIYLAIDWSMYFVQYVHYDSTVYKVSFDFWWAFHSANVTFTANRLNFLVPGGEGTIEFFLRTFIYNLSSWNFSPKITGTEQQIINTKTELVKSITNNGIIIWRFFGSLLPAAIGLFGVIGWVSKKAIDVKHGQKFIKEEK